MKEKRKTAFIVPGALDFGFYHNSQSIWPAKYGIRGPAGEISQIILNAIT